MDRRVRHHETIPLFFTNRAAVRYERDVYVKHCVPVVEGAQHFAGLRFARRVFS